MSLSRHLQWHFLLVFIALPLIIAVNKPHSWIYIILWIAAFLAWRALVKNHGYHFKHDWNIAALNRPVILAIFKRYVPLAIALFVFTWVSIPERLFSLPLERPQTWVMVMILYPLLSVIPQEILFRSFFFHHYRPWLKSDKAISIASALAFGWVHIVLLNWVAVVFSAIGGWLFANTYRKTNSLAAACFEHALYGCTIFTLGLGFYFYHGQAVR